MTGAGYALVDGNNFFVSCERIFAPKLIGRPVVVLSNNDGCVVSRSYEAKALGVPMAAPWFKLRDLAKRQGITGLSANFELYSDMSERLMRLLRETAPGQEVYSIDECFLDWSAVAPADAPAMAAELRARVLRSLGLPCGFGVGETKTLAKLANATAKKNPAYMKAGYCVLAALAPDEREALMRKFPVEDIWGVGRKTAPVLHGYGIRTAAALRDADRNFLRSRGGVTMVRIADELAGTDCLRVEADAPAESRQSILCSRSFGEAVYDEDTLAAAVAGFAAKAAASLREEGSIAAGIIVFARTDEHRPEAAQHALYRPVTFSEPTDDTFRIVATATRAARAGFVSGNGYKKAGVTFFGLTPAAGRQMSLFGDSAKSDRSAGLMEAMDAINRVASPGARLRVASEMGREQAAARADTRSPRYTTRWDHLAVAKAR